jgi:type I restriction enzyme S subunit
MKTDSLRQNIPSGWEEKKLLDCLDIPSKITGIKLSEYEKEGEFPVFDQGQDYISGFSSNKDLVVSDVPAILFGDHTRIVKYIKSPFVAGADGTKIFWVKDSFDSTFIYYVVLNQKIPNTGYNRHFKFFKDIKVVLPESKKEQQKIAEILGAVDEDITKTQELIDTTEKLKKGLMQELFTRGIGHTKFKETKLGDVCNFTTGKLNSNRAVVGGEYPFFTCSQETFEIDQYSFDQKAILLAGNNAAGKYSVKYYEGKFDAYQRTYVISVKDENETSYSYIKEVLNARLNELQDSSVGSTTKFLTLHLLQNLSVSLPSIKEQKEIADILSAIDEKISVNKRLKEKLITLKKGLMQDLLSGRVRVNIN